VWQNKDGVKSTNLDEIKKKLTSASFKFTELKWILFLLNNISKKWTKLENCWLLL